MSLAEFLRENALTRAAFAERVSSTPATISRLCAAKMRPSHELIQRIADATDWQVPPEVWFDRPEDASRDAA